MFQTRITRETKLSFQNNHNLNEENIFSYNCKQFFFFFFHLKRRVRSVLEYNIFRDPIAWSTLGRGLSKLEKIYRLQIKAKNISQTRIDPSNSIWILEDETFTTRHEICT